MIDYKDFKASNSKTGLESPIMAVIYSLICFLGFFLIFYLATEDVIWKEHVPNSNKSSVINKITWPEGCYEQIV